MKKRILLVLPLNTEPLFYPDLYTVRDLTRRKGTHLNLSLPTVAGLTPPEFEVRVLDENVEPIDYSEHYDIVGLTTFANQFDRARQIAEDWRKRGALIVAGGPSASLIPHKWKPIADVVIVGEAERIWPQFCRDYLAGSYKEIYREEGLVELAGLPLPDYSSIPTPVIHQYLNGVVETGRGCPYECEFCCAVVVLGRKLRFKRIDTVIEELEQVYQLGLHRAQLCDVNLTVERDRAKALLRRIRDWNATKRRPMKLYASVSLDVVDDEELLELLPQAGVCTINTGVESVNVESLRETRKFQNIRPDLTGDIMRFHEHGIMVIGGAIVGFDHDDLSVFRRQFDFWMRTAAPLIQVNPLQAFDGTMLKERMEKEGRYVDPEISLRGRIPTPLNMHTLIPKQLTPAQVRNGTIWLLARLYEWDNLADRVERFFEMFERSPKRKKLSIPGGPPELHEIGIAARILKHLLLKAPMDEKKALARMMAAALRSSHPFRFSFAVGSYLAAKDTRQTLALSVPGFERVGYPGPEPHTGETNAPPLSVAAEPIEAARAAL